MSRHEPLTSLNARSEDCFAQVDAVCNAVATELAWSDDTEHLIVPPAPRPAARFDEPERRSGLELVWLVW